MSVCFQYAEKGTCSYGDRCRFEHVAGAGVKQQSKQAKKKKRSQPRVQLSSARNYIDEFFSTYPAFDYDPSESFMDEFYRMCDDFGWDDDDEEKEEARDRVRDAMVNQFNTTYGTNANDLESWQKLCEVIGIQSVPQTLQECRGAVVSSHVNICDLLDAPLIGTTPERYPSEVELSEYTIMTGRYFPRDNVYAGSLLKYLLRNILNPQRKRATRSTRKRG